MLRHLLAVSTAALCLCAPAGLLEAAGGTVTDQAVSLTYSATHWSAIPGADFKGTEPGPTTDAVYQTGWWYRVVGVDSREHPLPTPTSETYDGPVATISWSNVDGKGFDAKEVTSVYDNERPSGTFTSRLSLTNTSGTQLAFEVFHYLDADAGGTAANDSGTALGDRLLYFHDGDNTDGLYRAHFASAFQVGAYPQVRDLLNDNSPTELTSDGTSFGPGDWSAAYQWSATLAPGEERDVAWVAASSRVVGAWVKGDMMFANNNADVVLWRPDTHQLLLWDMRRETRVETLILGTSRQPVGADGFTGNYESDFVLYNTTTGQVSFKSLSNGEIDLSGAPLLALNWKLSATADFNHDGKPDIVWRNSSSQKIVIWKLGEGSAPGTQRTGSIVPSPDQAVDANWEIVGARDFDYDGNVDFVWYNPVSGKIVIWYMDASVVRISGGFTSPSSAGNNNWRVVATADYGRGAAGLWGTPDLLWRNATSGKLVVWHMASGGVRTSGVFTTPDSAGDLAWQVVGPR